MAIQKFQEIDIEEVAIHQMKSLGWQYVKGENLNKKDSESLIKEDLAFYLFKEYGSKGITQNEINCIIQYIESLNSTDLYDANKLFIKTLQDGFSLRRDDGSQPTLWINLINFTDINRNICKVANQVKIEYRGTLRIPDIVLYVNGIPLIPIELKSPNRKNTTLTDAFKQITIRYNRDIPNLMKYHAFTILSDGVVTKMGTAFTCEEKFFNWSADENGNRDRDRLGADSLLKTLKGVFTKSVFFDILQHFVLFSDKDSKEKVKIVVNSTQYYAAKKLKGSIKKNKKPIGDGKGGIYFGTPGCGKSMAMVFLARQLMRDPSMKNPTIVVISIGIGLDNQMYQNFVHMKEFIGDMNIHIMTSINDLREKLRTTQTGGIYLTTIQKFTEYEGVLNDRDNIIVFSDEAHHSQTQLEEKVKIIKADRENEGEVKITYGFAKHLRNALPNATYVAFTGTPIEKTIDVFGDIVEEYTMADAESDGVIVPTVFDSCFVEAFSEDNIVNKIETLLSEKKKQGVNPYYLDTFKEKLTVSKIANSKSMIEKKAAFFVRHYEERVKKGASVKGKCFYVGANREYSYAFYQELKRLRPEWFDEKNPKVRLIMTRGKDDPEEMYNLIGSDKDREMYATEFKDPDSSFKIAILVDMWTIGFDVPCMDTIYIDKMYNLSHTLIQVVSRVNRAYPGKNNGLIVDMAGVVPKLKFAVAEYGKYDKKGFKGINEIFKIIEKELNSLDMQFMSFNKTPFFNGDSFEKYKVIKSAVDFVCKDAATEKKFIESTYTLKKSYELCSSDCFKDEDASNINFYITVLNVIMRVERSGVTHTTLDDIINELIDEAIGAKLHYTDSNKEMTKVSYDIVALLDKTYTDSLKKEKASNITIKHLISLIENGILNLKDVNKSRADTFSSRMESVINEYNNRIYDANKMYDKLKEIQNKLIDIANDIVEEIKLPTQLKKENYRTKVYIDILNNGISKYNLNLELPISKIASSISILIDKETKAKDWYKRQSIVSDLLFNIINLLIKEKYSLNMEINREIAQEIIEHTKNISK